MTFFDNFLSIFINNAYAVPTGTVLPPPQGASGSSLITMAIVFFFFIYFTVWRPQSKRAKEQKGLLTSLVKDDEVVTAGGILGKIIKLGDDYVVLSLSDNAEMTVQKTSIVSALPKGTLRSVYGA